MILVQKRSRAQWLFELTGGGSSDGRVARTATVRLCLFLGADCPDAGSLPMQEMGINRVAYPLAGGGPRTSRRSMADM